MKAYIKPAIVSMAAEEETMICVSAGGSQGTVVAEAPMREKSRHSVIFDEDNEFDKIIEDF